MICPYCGGIKGPWHDDHIIPYSRGGSDDPRNLLPCCSRCNLAKSNKLPSEWLESPSLEILELERVALSVSKLGMKRKRGPDRKRKPFYESDFWWKLMEEDYVDGLMDGLERENAEDKLDRDIDQLLIVHPPWSEL